ncbi:MAG: hypothetical protein V1750_10270, partial [Acidobacteriota bacterium]
MNGLTGDRILAALPALAYAVLGATVAALGALPPKEVVLAALCVALAFIPSGWLAPGGWKRRAAELALLPAAYVLVLTGDPTMRRMLLPPLLVLAALAAALGALQRAGERSRPMILVALALASRMAGAGGLLGEPLGIAAIVLLAVALVTWGASRWGGTNVGLAVALLAGTLPLQKHPFLALAVALIMAGSGELRRAPALAQRAARAWLPAVVAASMLSASLAPWGGISLGRLFPAAGWESLV